MLKEKEVCFMKHYRSLLVLVLSILMSVQIVTAVFADDSNLQQDTVVTELSATYIGGRSVELRWNASERAVTYLIYTKDVSSDSFYLLRTTHSEYAQISDVVPGAYNSYYVRAKYYEGQTLVLGEPSEIVSVYVDGTIGSVSGLTANPYGKKDVLIEWNPTPGAHGYLIYRKIGSQGVYGYRYIVVGTSFIDTTASSAEKNFYWVYPYYLNDNNTRTVGTCPQYASAKAMLPRVTHLEGVADEDSVTLSWNPVEGATGYIIYRRVNISGPFTYRYIVSGPSFEDTDYDPTFFYSYHVHPYYISNGKRIITQDSPLLEGYGDFFW